MPNPADASRSRLHSERGTPELWERAFEILGTSAPDVRPMIGRALKEHGPAIVSEFLDTLELESPHDPVRFFFGLMHSQKAFAVGVAKDPLGQYRSVRYVLERQIFPNDPQLARRFRDSVFRPALDLNLKGTDQPAVLAYNLGQLHLTLVDKGKDVNEAMNLLSQYVMWLQEKDWENATLNVLRYESSAFIQFRITNDPTCEDEDDLSVY